MEYLFKVYAISVLAMFPFGVACIICDSATDFRYDWLKTVGMLFFLPLPFSGLICSGGVLIYHLAVR